MTSQNPAAPGYARSCLLTGRAFAPGPFPPHFGGSSSRFLCVETVERPERLDRRMIHLSAASAQGVEYVLPVETNHLNRKRRLDGICAVRLVRNQAKKTDARGGMPRIFQPHFGGARGLIAERALGPSDATPRAHHLSAATGRYRTDNSTAGQVRANPSDRATASTWPALNQSQHRGTVPERAEAGPQATAHSVVVAPCATPGDETPRRSTNPALLPDRATRSGRAQMCPANSGLWGRKAPHEASASQLSGGFGSRVFSEVTG